MASATLAELRITHAKLSARRPRSLDAVLELPHELIFEVRQFFLDPRTLISYLSCRSLNFCTPSTFTI